MDITIVIQKFVKGAVKAALLALIAFLAANKIDASSVDVETLTTGLTLLISAIIGGGFEALRNFLKVKYAIKWL